MKLLGKKQKKIVTLEEVLRYNTKKHDPLKKKFITWMS